MEAVWKMHIRRDHFYTIKHLSFPLYLICAMHKMIMTPLKLLTNLTS